MAPGSLPQIRTTALYPGEAERKAAAKLGKSAAAIAGAAERRYGQSLTAERDIRVAERTPEDAERRTVQAVRGHVTRELLDELAPDLKEEQNDGS